MLTEAPLAQLPGAGEALAAWQAVAGLCSGISGPQEHSSSGFSLRSLVHLHSVTFVTAEIPFQEPASTTSATDNSFFRYREGKRLASAAGRSADRSAHHAAHRSPRRSITHACALPAHPAAGQPAPRTIRRALCACARHSTPPSCRVRMRIGTSGEPCLPLRLRSEERLTSASCGAPLPTSGSARLRGAHGGGARWRPWWPSGGGSAPARPSAPPARRQPRL